MKEMVGGCCVCSDDRGWTENPLVYCDGPGCNVAVHQACYGIVTVPSGPWFCRKCESQDKTDKTVKVVHKCELCPSKDGALKRTDTAGWAHVVCALYIPEVRFGDVSSMEPIILSMIPPDRYSKNCYICESQGREAKSKLGACMNCNKSGCKHHFHVTCAQAMGLLCEEAGNYMDNVKYCGYCQHHYSKLKKGSNLRAIPAFKPMPAAGGSKDSTSDKVASQPSGATWSNQHGSGTSNGSKEKRKKASKKSTSGQVSPKGNRDSSSSSVIVETPTSGDDLKRKSEPIPFANVLAGVGLVPGPRALSELSNSAPVPEETVEPVKQDVIKSNGTKKNDKNIEKSPISTEVPEKIRASRRKNSTRSATPNSLAGHDTESTLSNASEPPPELAAVPEPIKTSEVDTCAAIIHSVIVSSASATAALQVVSPALPGGSSLLQESPAVPAAKKPRRGRAPKVSAAPVAPDSPPSSPDSAEQQPAKRRKKPSRSVATVLQSHPMAPITQTETFIVHPTPLEVVMKQEILPVKEDHTPEPAKDLNHTFIRNGMPAPHMLGNQLNPTSSVADTMTDTLKAEMEAHSVGTQPSPSSSLVGVPFPVRAVSPSLKMNSTVPQHLEQLLERQWEQGSQFLLEQAQHFDIASLLSCLHNLRQENMRLEDHVASLNRRRDHLLAVNARLSVPLTIQPGPVSFGSTNLPDRSTPVPGPSVGLRASPQERNNRGTPYLPPAENGVGLTDHLSAYVTSAFSHRLPTSTTSDRVIPSPVIVSSRMNSIYQTVGAPPTISPVQGSSSYLAEGRNLTVLRSPSSTPELVGRNSATPSQPMYAYQMVSPPISHHSAMPSQHGMNARRDVPDPRHPRPVERR